MAVSFPHSKFASGAGSTALATAFTTTGGNDILVCIENSGGGTTGINDGSANVYVKIGSKAGNSQSGGPSELWLCTGALSRASATWTITNGFVTGIIEVAGQAGGYGTSVNGGPSSFRSTIPYTFSLPIAATSTMFGYCGIAIPHTGTISTSPGTTIGQVSGSGTGPGGTCVYNTGSGSTSITVNTSLSSISSIGSIAVEIKSIIFTRRQRGC